MSTDAWAGPPLDTLRRLEQHLCRCRNRTLLFGGNEEAVLAHAPAGMAGRVIDHAFAFLSDQRSAADRGQPRPKKMGLAAAIGQPVGRLLAGRPPAGGVWVRKARSLLGYLTTGGRPAGPDQQVVADRIDDYFFREFFPGEPGSAFFQAWRRRHPDPCSKTELAGEVHWLARAKELVPAQPARLAWVLGPGPFPADNPQFLDAVAHCLEAGVDVAVAYTDQRPAGGGGPRPSDGVRGRFGRTGRVRRVELGRPTPAGGPADGWWGFVTPGFQYLYLAAGADETLFVLRGPDTDEQRAFAPVPVAFHAKASERQAFLAWLAAIDPSGPARDGSPG